MNSTVCDDQTMAPTRHRVTVDAYHRMGDAGHRRNMRATKITELFHHNPAICRGHYCDGVPEGKKRKSFFTVGEYECLANDPRSTNP